MCKSRITFLLFFTIASLCNAQEFRNDGRNGLGARAGVNMATVRFLPQVELGSFSGPYIGVQFIHQRDLTSFTVELNYAQYGWTETFRNPPTAEFTGNEIYSRTLNYLELPMIAYFRSSPNKLWHILAFAGPKLNFLLSESVTDTTPASFERYYYDEPIEPHTEFGLLFGGGFSYEFKGVGEFGVEGRYNISFENLFERQDTAAEIEYSQPQGFMIGINYWYYF